MITPPEFASFEDAYVNVLEHISGSHQYRNAPRGNESRECLGLSFRLSDPRARLPFLAARKVNPIFHWAEALWYLGGRNDVEMVAYHAPHMRPDSIDGVTIGGSAYGHRMFNPQGGDATSPFDRVLSLLREEENTKRGVMPIFEGRELATEGNPDVSCVVALHLLAREGQLHMVCYMRANDCDRGLLADVFCFTVIQEFAAVRLGLELGTYMHHIGSAHIGDRDHPRVQRVLAEAADREWSPRKGFPFPAMPTDTTSDTVTAVLKHEEALRRNEAQYRPEDIARLSLTPYWQQVVLLFEIKRQLVHCRPDPVQAGHMTALDPGLAWLVARRWPPRMPHGAGQ